MGKWEVLCKPIKNATLCHKNNAILTPLWWTKHVYLSYRVKVSSNRGGLPPQVGHDDIAVRRMRGLDTFPTKLARILEDLRLRDVSPVYLLPWLRKAKRGVNSENECIIAFYVFRFCWARILVACRRWISRTGRILCPCLHILRWNASSPFNYSWIKSEPAVCGTSKRKSCLRRQVRHSRRKRNY